MNWQHWLAALSLAVPVSTAAQPTLGQPVVDFYRGKTISLISAGSAGAAHGTYAQILAKYVRRHMPGTPNVIIQYMPGAAGIKAINYLANAMPRDGTAIGVPLQDLVFAARLGFPGVQYNPEQMYFLGGADVTRSTITVMAASGFRTLEETQTREVLMGGAGTSATPYIVPVVLNHLLGTKFKVINGYAGLAEIHMAMDRGEVQGRAATWQSVKETKPDWVRDGKIVNLITVSLDREPDLPDVRSLADFNLPPDARTMVELVAGNAAHGRAWIAPAGVPAERVAAMRDAYWKAVQDPEFVAEAKERGLELRPVRWEVQQKLAEEMMAASEPIVARLKQILAAP